MRGGFAVVSRLWDATEALPHQPPAGGSFPPREAKKVKRSARFCRIIFMKGATPKRQSTSWTPCCGTTAAQCGDPSAGPFCPATRRTPRPRPTHLQALARGAPARRRSPHRRRLVVQAARQCAVTATVRCCAGARRCRWTATTPSWPLRWKRAGNPRADGASHGAAAARRELSAQVRVWRDGGPAGRISTCARRNGATRLHRAAGTAKAIEGG